MVKNISIKILIVSLIFINILAIPNMVHATDTTPAKIWRSAREFVALGKTENTGAKTKIADDALEKTSTTIFNVFFAVGVVVATIAASYLGIQFMVASAEDKAEVKKSLVPFAIGTFVVFGAFGIWRILLNVLAGL